MTVPASPHAAASAQQQQHDGCRGAAAPGVPSHGFNVATSSPCFPVACTPIGTDIYLALEALKGILHYTSIRAKWITNNKALYQLDVYGAGTAAFCMSNGRPPFRPPDSYRRIAKEQRMREIAALVEAGAVFAQCVTPNSRAMTTKLLDNDIDKRLTLAAALQEEWVRDAKDVLVTVVGPTGIADITMRDSRISAAQAPLLAVESATTMVASAGQSKKSSTAANSAAAPHDDVDDSAFVETCVNEFARLKEDGGE